MQEKKIKSGVMIAAGLIIICGVFTAVNLVIYSAGKKKDKIRENGAVPVIAAIASEGEITDRISQTGNIQSRSSVDVYSKIPGKIIREILVDTGSHIKKGDVVARLETDAVTARLAEAGAELDAAEAGYKAAEASLDVLEKDRIRHENLLAEKAVAARQVDHIIAQYKSASENRNASTARIRKAKAVIRQLEIALSDHTVTAPISGTVTKRYSDPGTMSSASAPVIRISEENSLKIVTTVTQKNLPKIKKNMNATVSVDSFPDEKFEGKIDIVSDEIRPENRMSEIEVNLDNRNNRLKPGMFAEISIVIGKRHGILIPRDALLRLPGTGSFYVFAIENGNAVQKNIEIGIQENDRTEIISGLKAGENVVIQGHNRLRDGDSVKTAEKDREAAS